jgi:aminoglycoside phosphotransferase (APT) family kinase protein
MIDSLLLDLALRESALPGHLASQLKSQRRALAMLQGIRDPVPPRTADQNMGNSARAESAVDQTICGSELEIQVARVMCALPHISTAERADAAAALRDAISAEKQLMQKMSMQKHDAARARGYRADNDRIMERDRLTEYLRKHMAGDIQVESVVKAYGGYSKETFIVQLSGAGGTTKGIVIRKDVDGGPVEGSAVDELPLLRALRLLEIPVAQPLWAETDASLFGSRFIVVEFVHGKPGMNLNEEVTGESPDICCKLLAQMLAKIHRLDLSALPMLPAGAQVPLRDHVERLLDKFESQYKRRRIEPSVIVTAAFAWMRANIPSSTGDPAFVHGDASLRNLLVNEGKVGAMIDWELWHIGDPMEDLAYCKHDIEKIMPWSEFLHEYYAHGGVEYQENSAAFYGLWQPLRNATMVANLVHDFTRRTEPDDIRGPYARGTHYTSLLQVVADRLESFKEFTA